MRVKFIVVLLLLSVSILSKVHNLKENFSYPLISHFSDEQVKFKADWGIEYNVSIYDRFYGTMGFNNLFWLNTNQSLGTDYTSFFAGVSYDLINYRKFILNSGVGAGFLFHLYQGSGENYYPHYFLSVSPRIPINEWFGIGFKYSLSNGANNSIFKESINSFGLDATLNFSKPVNKLAEKWKITKECNQDKFTGYNITGYSFLFTGILCSMASIPFFIHAFEVTPQSDISYAIGMTFGSLLLGSGTVFEIGSIPFFVMHKNKVCSNKN